VRYPARNRQQPDATNGQASQVWLTLIPIVFAGVGGLAFVAGVGGLVTEARYHGAGLPSGLAASVLPQGQLLAIGATLLGGVFVAALGLVAIVHWWDDPLALEAIRWAGKTSRPLREKLFADKKLPSAGLWFFALILVTAGLAYTWVWHGHLWALATLPFGVAAVVGALAIVILAQHATACRAAGDARGESKRLAALFGVVSILAALAATFAGLTYPIVRPVAVSLNGPPEVLCGLYVGETSDRVYIGEAVRKPRQDTGVHPQGAVIVVDRARVNRLVIGSFQPLADALPRSRSLAKDLGAGSRQECGIDYEQHAANMKDLE
jgi:hypothetical protein